jgi:hypothetical protein
MHYVHNILLHIYLVTNNRGLACDMLLDLVIGLIIWLQTEIKQISLHPLTLMWVLGTHYKINVDESHKISWGTTTGGLIRDAHGKFICDRHFYNRLG